LRYSIFGASELLGLYDINNFFNTAPPFISTSYSSRSRHKRIIFQPISDGSLHLYQALQASIPLPAWLMSMLTAVNQRRTGTYLSTNVSTKHAPKHPVLLQHSTHLWHFSLSVFKIHGLQYVAKRRPARNIRDIRLNLGISLTVPLWQTPEWLYFCKVFATPWGRRSIQYDDYPNHQDEISFCYNYSSRCLELNDPAMALALLGSRRMFA
jgi:hypothetical protein